jgi:hypothetical protein
VVKGGNVSSKGFIPALEPEYEVGTRQDSTGHREKLISAPMDTRKGAAKDAELFTAKRLLVRRPMLSRVAQKAPSPVQQWISRPGFAKDCDAARPEHATQLGRGE